MRWTPMILAAVSLFGSAAALSQGQGDEDAVYRGGRDGVQGPDAGAGHQEPRRKVALRATFIVPMVHTSWTGRPAVIPST